MLKHSKHQKTQHLNVDALKGIMPPIKTHNNNNEDYTQGYSRQNASPEVFPPHVGDAHGYLGPPLVMPLQTPGALAKLKPKLRRLSSYNVASVFDDNDFLGLEIPEEMLKTNQQPKPRVSKWRSL